MHEQIVQDLAIRVFLIAILTSLPAIILAVATLLTALRGMRRQDTIESRLNGRLDELLTEARERARLEGLRQGLEHAREGSAPPPIDTEERRA